MRNLKLKFQAVFISVMMLICCLPMPALAEDVSPSDAIQCGVNSAAGENCTAKPPADTVNNTIATIINVISYLAGAAAVVMIIIGGFRFVTSSGNPEASKGARNTIIYAVIGLVIIAIAQVIVHFVINTTTNATADCANGKTSSGQKCTP